MALSKILPASQEQYVGARNLIINGNFGIDQRNSGSAVTSTGPIYTVDRWVWSTQTGSGHTIQQVTDAPADFNNSVKVTIGTGASPSTSQQNNFVQHIEGNNFSHLNFGSSDARAMTFSFYVKSSITGTFNVWFHNSGNARHYVSEYTISLADTWEKKIVTISSGDTTGTWNTDNSKGVSVGFSLGAGTDFDTTVNSWADGSKKSTSSATDLVATSGATWQITGCQLEVGSATPFEHEPFAVTKHKCQRYYQRAGNVSGFFTDTTGRVRGLLVGETGMRAQPTASNTTGLTLFYKNTSTGGGAITILSGPGNFRNGPASFIDFDTTATSTVQGQGCAGDNNTDVRYFELDAEL